MKKVKKKSTVIFTAVKYCSILHRRVCVMLGYDTHRNDRSVNPHGVVFFAAKTDLELHDVKCSEDEELVSDTINVYN